MGYNILKKMMGKVSREEGSNRIDLCISCELKLFLPFFILLDIFLGIGVVKSQYVFFYGMEKTVIPQLVLEKYSSKHF